MFIWKQVNFKQIELSKCVELILDLFICLKHEQVLVHMVCWLFKTKHHAVKEFETEPKKNLVFDDTYYLRLMHPTFISFFYDEFWILNQSVVTV